jgi:group I intron endonuclease
MSVVGLVGVVYGFRLETTSEYRYVGLTTASIRRRTLQHYRNAELGRKTPFYDWLRKVPQDLVYVESLEVVTTTLEALGEAEIAWIAKIKKRGDRLLNLSGGGLGPSGVVWTEEQRKAAGDRARGRPTGVSRKGPESPVWGSHHSDEQKRRWSEMRKGSYSGADNPNFGKFGSDHPSFGHKMSEESKERLSQQRRGALNPNFGRTTSDETRAKISAASKGRPMPSSVRNAHTRHHTNKSVVKSDCKYCIEDAAQNLNESTTGTTNND